MKMCYIVTGSVLLLLALTVGLAFGAPRRTTWDKLTTDYSFEDYKREFGRSYDSTTEESMRRDVFSRRLATILKHNADASQTYKMGVTQYTDRTDGERKIRGYDKNTAYASRATRATRAATPATATRPTTILKDPADLPVSLDWRDKNVVTPVKNQGQCGSCWTFASTEALESAHAIKTGQLIELSEQFILDCTPNPQECGGTGGCFGGTAELAYARLKELGGIPSEWTYPYISGMGAAGKCHGVPLVPAAPHQGNVSAAATLSGHVSVPSNNYAAVLNALATEGPLAVSVDAGAWHDYESGIFTGGNHTNPDLDHLVLLVGYGAENGQDYWIVRNSWTPLWGENGYVRLARYGQDAEHCGTDVTPLDGNGCKNGPPTVKVCGQNGVLYDAVYPEMPEE